MRKTFHRPLAAACLAALLASLSPIAVLGAPPSDATAGVVVYLDQLLDWLGWHWPVAVGASQESSPDTGSTGTVAGPPGFEPLNPDAATTQQPGPDGETSPNVDPDG
jgi:hypothetical protein